MKQALHEVNLATKGRGIYDLTRNAESFVSESGISLGFLTMHVKHTSASLLIQENADPEVRRDLERFFSRLCPDGDRLFRHTCEGPDDMPAHVRSALTCVNTTIPISEGRLMLGTWQGLFLWEHRTAPHQRRICLYSCGE